MPAFEPVVAAFEGFADADPTYCAQLAVHVGGERLLDLSRGMGMDALLPVFSSSKGASAVVISLLLERGQLDLDATVASYWPEFAQKGKGAVTVRQLLSHQAGLNGVDGGFTTEELLAHAPLAERLAAQRPLWHPGAGVEYHAVTLGTLADELVRRIDGRTLADVLSQDVATPRGIDIWMGTPESQDHRVLEAMPPTSEEFAAFLANPPAGVDLVGGGGTLASLSLPAGGIFDLFTRVNSIPFRRVGPPAAGMTATAAWTGRSLRVPAPRDWRAIPSAGRRDDCPDVTDAGVRQRVEQRFAGSVRPSCSKSRVPPVGRSDPSAPSGTTEPAVRWRSMTRHTRSALATRCSVSHSRADWTPERLLSPD